MMHAIIRNGHDAIHLIGHVDAYNVESLRDHVRGMRGRGQVSLSIDISPADTEALQRHAGRWLERLVADGMRVAVRAGNASVPISASGHAA
ncbi:MAG TPA: hypothetical protein VNO26_12280 [Candidatus Limnocylindria bacterium]|nr:hypothetical protein [Candidatus Limnocylindria bacterium]